MESNAVDIEFEEDKEFSKRISLNAVITNESLAWSVDSLGMQPKLRATILTVSNNQAKILDV
ncbi:hypothetical protein [uncultured Nostoc sp.]|uniref:hypothetical protein n=1 Tax=uncultured Nostoc sp. TaxID=340711 RepID=UPI00260F27BC|nr:hypothetical protein [uncultured Nostoc sp.]